MWMGGFDLADDTEFGDLNALVFRKGSVLNYANDWGGVDVGVSTRRAAGEAINRGRMLISYDSVGVGAGAKAEANRLSKELDATGAPIIPRGIDFVPWNAGGAVLRPEERVIPGDGNSPKNMDYFANVKAQAWWSLRRRFERTYRAVKEGLAYKEDEMISLSSADIPKLHQLQRELSQATIEYDSKLRMRIEKKPDGTKSPNLADAVVMCFFPIKVPMIISQDVLLRARMESRR
jgi:phage terminase large subunit